MAKKILQLFLFVFFLVFILCAVVVGSYMLNTPSHDGDTRILINGAWIDKENNTKFEFGDNAKFTVTDTSTDDVIADGYFKVEEDTKKIKLFILPKHYDSSFEDAIRYEFFAQLTYSDLADPAAKKDATDDEKKIKPTCNFMMKQTNVLYKCEMPEKTLDLFSGK